MRALAVITALLAIATLSVNVATAKTPSKKEEIKVLVEKGLAKKEAQLPPLRLPNIDAKVRQLSNADSAVVKKQYVASKNALAFWNGKGRWLRAPQQEKCWGVPWQRSCTLARASYKLHLALMRTAERKMAYDYHYNWQQWLPDKWQRIVACETGYGKRPGNWRHANSSFQGAFGFATSSWDAFVPRADPKAGPYPSEAYLATPRQQYEVALAIYRMYGLSGWGCRGA